MDIPKEIYDHYQEADEDGRLKRSKGILEFERSKQIIERFLHGRNMRILDVGGGTGAYSFWLAELGHQVILMDPMPSLIEVAKRNPRSKELHEICLGDVREINSEETPHDLILCFGPFYHLTDSDQREIALQELFRNLKPGAFVLIAGISKYVSLIQSGFFDGMLEEDVFKKIVEQDLKDGQHRNPVDNTTYFTTSIFMEPKALETEVLKAGFVNIQTIAVEGPGWLHKDLKEIVKDNARLKELMSWITKVEGIESLMGMSTHFMVVGQRPN
ncbi:class I SAM-dependent methyltransferase [Aureisphaera galaxeae]|uniref:class I SAM-dependent methyltransferase n=1 Tax=Aureisphaera galaxeae TaxID=1538023 RepID=UPI0023500B3F|nr:class I SAM-dependent methyltransferase [Aureisphaera galaxeae]MDC8002788.1 class I SAM-dependent methyltransferase [Aureisphaera galaxeae]